MRTVHLLCHQLKGPHRKESRKTDPLFNFLPAKSDTLSLSVQATSCLIETETADSLSLFLPVETGRISRPVVRVLFIQLIIAMLWQLQAFVWAVCQHVSISWSNATFTIDRRSIILLAYSLLFHLSAFYWLGFFVSFTGARSNAQRERTLSGRSHLETIYKFLGNSTKLTYTCNVRCVIACSVNIPQTKPLDEYARSRQPNEAYRRERQGRPQKFCSQNNAPAPNSFLPTKFENQFQSIKFTLFLDLKKL